MATTDIEFHTWIRTIRVEEDSDVFFGTTEEDPTLFVSALTLAGAYAAVRSAIICRFTEKFQCDASHVVTAEDGTLAHKKLFLAAMPVTAAPC